MPPKLLAMPLRAYNELTIDSVGRTDNEALGDILSTTEPTEYQIGVHPPVATFRISTANAITYPTVLAGEIAWHPVDDEDAIEMQIAGVDIFPLMRSVVPTQPTAADGADALILYAVLKGVHDLYMAEMALHAAYMAAVMAEVEADDDELSGFFATNFGELVPEATGRDNMLHPYVVTIKPKYPAGKAEIVLKIGAWEDTNVPISNKYTPPLTEAEYTEGVTKLTIKVGREILTALTAGVRLNLPHAEGAMIPASGSYLLTKNKDGSGINYSHEVDAENKAHLQTLAQLKFNVRAGDLPNLETFLANGGTIDLVAYDGTAATAAYISEVMWVLMRVRTIRQIANGLRSRIRLLPLSPLVRINGHYGSIKRMKHLLRPMQKQMVRLAYCLTDRHQECCTSGRSQVKVKVDEPMLTQVAQMLLRLHRHSG